jgi:solute:Na+ symporter, SSS family
MTLLVLTCFYLFSNLLIGFWASRRVHNAEDFVLAGRKLSLPVAATTIFATWFGSETILSSSAEFAQGGFIAVIKDPFGASLCLLLIGLFFARPLYRMKIVTLSDFFRIRFNRQTEVLSALLLSFSYISWIAAQMVAMGTILSVLANGAGFALSVPAAICIGASLVTAYTFIGGMWAVSMTDFVQSIVIVAGLLLLSIMLTFQLGGIMTLIGAQTKGFFNILPENNPEAIMSYAEAWILVGLGSIPNQDVFQRTMAARNEKTAVRAAFLSSFLYLSIAFLPLILGLCGKELLPELLLGSDEEKQMLLPSVVLAYSPIWLQLLFFGALMSAIMSTTSGAILAPASVVSENLVKQFWPAIGDKHLLKTLRISVLFIAIVSLWQALGGESIYSLAADSSAMSLVTLFFPLMMGLYWKKTSKIAAILSMLSGFLCWILYDYMWNEPPVIPSVFSASLLSFAVLFICSFIFPDKQLLIDVTAEDLMDNPKEQP